MRFLIALLLSFLPILGAVQKGGDIDLPQGQVHEGDYFASGKDVKIYGTVTGDVYAFGAEVIIDGRVEGDVIASGKSVEVGGEVIGSARLAGNDIVLNGSVARNCTIMGNNIQMMPGSIISGNAIFMGNSINLSGDIMGKATLTASSLEIMGKIGKNTKAYVSNLHIGRGAQLNGDLEYRSSKKADIDQGATIRGDVTYNHSKFFSRHWGGKLIFGTILASISMNFVFSFLVGLILIKLLPEKLRDAIAILRARPIKAIFIGLLFFILIPIAAIIIAATIIGIPVALVLIALWILLLYAAKIVPIMWCSDALFASYNRNHIRRRLGPVWMLLVGLILYFLVTRIPILGGLINILFMLIGLGCLILSRNSRKVGRSF